MIEQAMNLKARYEKMVEAFREEDFKGWFTEFFALYPFITKLEWSQFTPYFNDGDECVFSVNSPEVELSLAYLQKHPKLNVGDSDYYKGEGEPPQGRCVSTYGSLDKRYKVEYPDLYDALEAIKTLFEAEDIMRHVFGEHSEVVVTPEKIVVEECEHD